MGYREYQPVGALADLVACTWERTVPHFDPVATRVLPDGCVDLVWRPGELFVAGPDRAAVVSPVEPGTTIVGLRLRTGTAGAVLGVPAHELLDSRDSLDAIWGRRGATLADQIADTPDPARQRRLLEHALLAARSEMREPDPLVLAASRELGRPGSRVAALSEQFATSERQLLRRFDAAVGYGPKMLDRVLRLRRFLSRAANDDRVSLADLASALGYADQAHLGRDCLRLTGLTPAQLVASRRPSADVEQVA